MKVLIVGCGYVGLPLGTQLACAGHQVFGLRRSSNAADELRAAGILPLAADITQPEDLLRLPGDYDWAVNCVSASGGGAEEYARVYLEGTRNLLKWLSAHPPRKFVYTSSTGVYGQDDGSIVDETCPTNPPSETGRVLVRAEEVLREAARTGFPAVIMRVAGIYGPGRGYWLRQFLAGQAVMEGDGSRWLNMVHRDDVAGAAIAALERGTPGEAYNVCDNEPVTQRTLFEWLSNRLGRPMPPSVSAGASAGRRGATNKRISNSRLREQLGYKFKLPTFREGYNEELKNS